MIHEAETLLQEFAAYAYNREHEEDILSLYLVVDPADERNWGQAKWPIFLRNSLGEIENGLDARQTKQWKTVRLSDTSERTKWARVRLRLENFLDGYRPDGKTLVLFISPDRQLTFELPVALDNQAHYGQPQIGRFLRALDEYQEYMVVLFAQDRARVVNIFLGESTDEVTIHVDQTWHRQVHKTAHHARQVDRLEEIDRRFARHAAAELDKHFMSSNDVERILFSGNMQLAHAVRNYMHPSVADQVIAMLPLPIDTPVHEIAAQIRPVAEAAERAAEQRLVDDLVSRAYSGGRAALGYKRVQEALDRHMVSELVLPYPTDMAAAEELLVKAIFSSADTEFVEGAAAEKLRKEGGLGAFLYYTS